MPSRFTQPRSSFASLLVGAISLAGVSLLQAFPPAPPHIIFGQLRDEFGSPLTREDARIIFESDNGTIIETRLMPGIAPGVNYEIEVPMDAGISGEAYRSDAMSPEVPFLITVLMGGETFVPLEMSGDLRQLGEPGESTRIDLTLGLDSDGDGLPDAWKDTVIAMSGNPDLQYSDITPDGDLDQDGLTNLEEYIAGTYAWDASDRFMLDIIQATPDGTALLEFLAIDGRTYSLEVSSDLKTWDPISFRLPASDAPGIERASYYSATVRVLNVEVQTNLSEPKSFRLSVR
ncbi:MAG TPA: hypothetical protein VJ960_10160 [Oceanipulchritudo sp.]|nr:hypothetical protein [Oceanipulchritudo sp.]